MLIKVANPPIDLIGKEVNLPTTPRKEVLTMVPISHLKPHKVVTTLQGMIVEMTLKKGDEDNE